MRIAVISGICGLIAATAFWPHIFTGRAEASLFDRFTARAQSQDFAMLSGFAPGAKLSYSILSEHGASIADDVNFDALGALNIPAPTDFATSGPQMVYNFSVSNEQQTLKILLRLNAKTGKLSVTGSGAAPLSKILLETGKESIPLYSDWAGLFERQIDSFSAAASAPFKIAFYGGIASDATARQSPAIIQILDAPGGGGPSSAGINKYTNSWCGDPPISVCRKDWMDNYQKKTVENYIHALMFMTEQLSAVAMQQTQMIASFIDAKNQMEVQRENQLLKAEIHKDYQPSEQMCQVGSFMRSLAATDAKATHDQEALSDVLAEYYANREGNANHVGPDSDFKNRLAQFKTSFCDPHDNNGSLDLLCKHEGGVGAEDKKRMNKDIDFMRTLESPYTIDANFTDGASTDDEEDVVALGRNLYWSLPFSYVPDSDMKDNGEAYLKARHLMALNNLAHTSYTNLAAMKAEAAEVEKGVPGWAYMKTLMRDFGMEDKEIAELLGANPSYFAQMDVLTKKMYQQPNFYTNLYDKPVNVERINAALQAIQLMQLRDHYEGALRREMLSSAMVEEALIPNAEKLQGGLIDTE